MSTANAPYASRGSKEESDKPFSTQWLDTLERDQQQDTTTGKLLIGSHELHVASVLAAYSNREDPEQPVWPSVATLVRKTHLSESSVRRALKRLAAARYIQIDGRQCERAYTLQSADVKGRE